MSKAEAGNVQRTRWIVVSALVGATVAMGAALHVYGKGSAGAPLRNGSAAPPTQIRFASPATSPVTFRGNLDRTAVLQGGDGVVRMELVIAGEQRAATGVERAPTDLVVILDRSGSMGGVKIDHARAAIRELIANLGPADRFGLVSYADGASLSIPLAHAGTEPARHWMHAVASLTPSGGTNMASGLDLALATVDRIRDPGRVPRVILISDGLANQGDTSFSGLRQRATRAARGEYVLSAVGVGHDFNEELMHTLADAGTGNYYYLESASGLAQVFAGEFDAARTTVATGLLVEIETHGGVRVLDAAGYPLERSGEVVRFRPGALFAGQERRVWVTLDVPDDRLGDYSLGRFALAYSDGGERTTLQFDESPMVACVEDPDRFRASIDADNWGRSVVGEAYGSLQDQVGSYVREGRQAEALRLIEAFERDHEELNASVNSPAVAGQLQEAAELEQQVREAFTGGDREQADKRNRLSKSASSQAVDQRRVGAKR